MSDGPVSNGPVSNGPVSNGPVSDGEPARLPAAFSAFEAAFGRRPEGAWAAPGRVNLIGEHTDYNDGFVLPFALRQGVVCTAAARSDQTLRVVSAQEPGPPVTVTMADLRPGALDGWAAYVLGVAWALRAAGHELTGADLHVDGDVPAGAGLSSSAALECATVSALAGLAGLDLDRAELAGLARRAENDFVGVPTGAMDQMAAMLCTEGHALFLDTRTLAVEQVPFDAAAAGLAVLVIDTRAPHRLVEGEYAERRATCEAAAARLGVSALRDIPADGLAAALDRLDSARERSRVRHVVTENARVLETVALLRAERLREAGQLLTASHASLRDDYEVSSRELDTAVDAALAAGALGARMTGGGFGGCAIALVEATAVPEVGAAVEGAFSSAELPAPVWFEAAPSPGARTLHSDRPARSCR